MTKVLVMCCAQVSGLTRQRLVSQRWPATLPSTPASPSARHATPGSYINRCKAPPLLFTIMRVRPRATGAGDVGGGGTCCWDFLARGSCAVPPARPYAATLASGRSPRSSSRGYFRRWPYNVRCNRISTYRHALATTWSARGLQRAAFSIRCRWSPRTVTRENWHRRRKSAHHAPATLPWR